jgi:hypothetical protein
MSILLVVGGGLFGSQAAAYARAQGMEARVFDPGLEGAASPAAAGLFQDAWVGRKLRPHYDRALPILDRLYGLRRVELADDSGGTATLYWIHPTLILEKAPVRQQVTAVGDGWLEAGGERHEGCVYVAAGVWCNRFLPGLPVYGKAGAAFDFAGERPGRIRPIAAGRQAIAFVRDAGGTYFSDGTAEREYTDEHDRLSLARAADLGLIDATLHRWRGWRPYTPGGPLFTRLGERTWLATGGRKMGTILGASYARRLVEDELGL